MAAETNPVSNLFGEKGQRICTALRAARDYVKATNVRQLMVCCFFLAVSVSGYAQNLILDGSSFETGYDGFSSFLGYTWTKHGLGGLKPRKGVIDASTAAHGRHSLKMFFHPPYGRKGFAPWCTFRWIKVEEGRKYTLSLYAKGSRDGQPLQVSVADNWQDWGWAHFKLTKRWKRYSQQITMGKTVGGYTRVLIPFPEDEVIWIDAVQLEKGELTDYAPGRPVDLGLSCACSTKYENLFFVGEEVVIKAAVFNNKTKERGLLLQYHVEDYFRGVPYQGERRLASKAGETTASAINLGRVKRGAYKATVKVFDEDSERLDVEEIVFGVIKKRRIAQNIDSQFGIHGFPYSILQDCGARWLRSYLLAWSVIEPEEGRFSWPEEREEDRRYLSNVETYKINVLPVLGAAPAWARSDKPAHGGWSKDQSKGARLPRLDAWGRYVFQVVSRYKDKFKYWEIFNEPTAWMSAEDYFPLLKTAYEAAKRADPNCKIIAGDTANKKDQFLQELIKLGALRYMDIFQGHYYGVAQSGPPEVKIGGEGADAVVAHLRKVFAANDKPDLEIWNTEEGTYVPSWYTKEIMPKSIEPWHRVPDVRRQARDMVRSHLIELGSGIRRVFWFYSLYSERSASARWIAVPENMYLVEYDGAPRPALVAYSVLTEKLTGFEALPKEVNLGENIHCFVFSRKDDSVAAVWYWGKKEKHMVLSMKNAPKIEVSNMMGNPVPTDGAETMALQITGNPLYIEGTGLPADTLFDILSNGETRIGANDRRP